MNPKKQVSMKALSLYFKKNSFISNEIDYYRICSIFRIVVVFIALIDFASLVPDWRLMFPSRPIVPIELGLFDTEYFPYLNPFYQFINECGISESTLLVVSSVLYLAILILCLLGIYFRVSFVLALMLQLFLFRSIPNYNYGYDNFITMSFFYCIIFPVGNYYGFKLKKIAQKAQQNKYFNLISFLRTHLCIVYFVSGLAKCFDSDWWNGNAIWRALASMDDFVYIPPVLLTFISVNTVVAELMYSFFVFSKYKKIAVINMILMHLGIGVFLGLSSFAFIMIVWNAVAFYEVFKNSKHEL